MPLMNKQFVQNLTSVFKNFWNTTTTMLSALRSKSTPSMKYRCEVSYDRSFNRKYMCVFLVKPWWHPCNEFIGGMYYETQTPDDQVVKDILEKRPYTIKLSGN